MDKTYCYTAIAGWNGQKGTLLERLKSRVSFHFQRHRNLGARPVCGVRNTCCWAPLPLAMFRPFGPSPVSLS